MEEYKRLSPDLFLRCMSHTQRHPPLVMMVTAPFYFLFGRGQDTGVMINSAIFLTILLFATYKIGEKLLNPKAGLFAAFILTMYPVIFNQLKIYMLDLPLTALVALSIYFLILSDNFKNLKYILLLVISSVIGFLIKCNFVLFLLIPILYLLLERLFEKKEFFQLGLRRRYRVRHIILIILSLTILYAVYNFVDTISTLDINHFPFIAKRIGYLQGLKKGPECLQTWPTYIPQGGLLKRMHALVWYFWGMINWQISFFYFVIFLIGAYFFIKFKFQYKRIILIWLVSSYFLISSLRYGSGINMEVSAVRYTMPLLPAVALISAAGIMKSPAKNLKYLLITFTIIFGLIQFIFISYPIGNRLRRIEIPVSFDDKYDFFPSSLIIFNPHSFIISGSDSRSHPANSNEDAKICKEILNVIERSSSYKTKKNITIIPDDTRLWYLQYLVFIKNKNFNVFCDWNLERNDLATMNIKNLKELILISDYIIDKEDGWQGEPFIKNFVGKIRDAFNLYKYKFVLIKEIPYSGNSKIFVYKRELL